jgi:FlaA1/EpsC-like NDP-sugar epimerase
VAPAQREPQSPDGEHLQRVVVVGAGEGGDQVLRTLRGSSDSSYLPVALLDDDPTSAISA